MKIGITGASGQLGRIVIEKLKSRTSPGQIVGLVRNPSKTPDAGVELRQFDYNEPDQMVTSLKGIDRLLLISSNDLQFRLKQHRNVIAAAKKAGVTSLVFTSILHADTTTLVLGPDYLATEQAVHDSGLSYAILRHAWYTENYLEGLSHAVSAGEVHGSAGEGKISAATREDLAEADAVILLSEDLGNKTYELPGDEAFTLASFAETLGEVSGKTIVYKNHPIEEYADILIQSGLPAPVAQFLAGTHGPTEKNELYDDSRQLSKLIGRKTTSLKQAIQRALDK